MAQEMDEDAEEELQELDKIFAKIDSDNDGQLSWEELVGGAEVLASPAPVFSTFLEILLRCSEGPRVSTPAAGHGHRPDGSPAAIHHAGPQPEPS